VTGEAKLSEAQLIASLADIRAKVIEMRGMASETTDPQKRDAYQQVADAIETHARTRPEFGSGNCVSEPESRPVTDLERS
jgi:hypothetical protein